MNPQISAEREAEILADIKAGMKYKLLIKKHRVATATLSLIKKKHGIPLRGRCTGAKKFEKMVYNNKVLDISQAANVCGISKDWAYKLYHIYSELKHKAKVKKEVLNNGAIKKIKQLCKCPKCSKRYTRELNPEVPEYSGDCKVWWKICDACKYRNESDKRSRSRPVECTLNLGDEMFV